MMTRLTLKYFFSASLALLALLAATAVNAEASQPGFFGQYYDIKNAPGAERPGVTSNPVTGPANPWYEPALLMFSRVDSSINFGSGFIPIKPSGERHLKPFAVHWTAAMVVPADDTYTMAMGSDDDSWLYIDGTVAIDNNGTHGLRMKSKKISLAKGNHAVDIYYAQRNTGSPSGFKFQPDSRLNFFTNANGLPVTTAPNGTLSGGNDGRGTGRVLGATTARYTPAVALYKTANSPAIYAIYANGQRHYIGSPSAFQIYGYQYGRVKVVSQETLDRYPEARLLRTPENATVYFLSSRPNKQWLRIPLLTPTVFVSYAQNEWGNVVVVDSLDLNTYPNANLVKMAGNDSIYLLRGNGRHPFVSKSVLEQLGYNAAEIMTITATHLQSFTVGDPIG